MQVLQLQESEDGNIHAGFTIMWPGNFFIIPVAPSVGHVPRDVTVEVGNPFKVKIPFTAKGAAEFKRVTTHVVDRSLFNQRIEPLFTLKGSAFEELEQEIQELLCVKVIPSNRCVACVLLSVLSTAMALLSTCC